MPFTNEVNARIRQITSSRLFKSLLVTSAVVLLIIVFSDDAMAGPGGQFVKQALKSKYGRIGGIVIGGLILLAFIALLPLIIYIWWKEKRGIAQTQKDLELLANDYSWFKWAPLEKRIKKSVKAIYKVWSLADLSSVRHLMTSDCYSTQQATLKRWIAEGYTIVCRLHEVKNIAPLATMVENPQSHSWVRVLVQLKVTDYLMDNQSREIVQGKDEVDNSFKTVWMFVHVDGEWLLHSIEEGSSSLRWANEKNSVNTSFLKQSQPSGQMAGSARRKKPSADPRRQRSKAAGSQAPQSDPPARKKKATVKKRKRNNDE